MVDLLAKPRKTIQDFMGLPEGLRAELIERGDLHVPIAQGNPSARRAPSREEARGHRRGKDLGRIYVAPFDVHLQTGDIVEPDLIFVAKANLKIVKDWIHGTPDLLIEVLSPDAADRDLLVKKDLYARNGVNGYWIVDPGGRSVEMFSLIKGRYEPRAISRMGIACRRLSSPASTSPAASSSSDLFSSPRPGQGGEEPRLETEEPEPAVAGPPVAPGGVLHIDLADPPGVADGEGRDEGSRGSGRVRARSMDSTSALLNPGACSPCRGGGPSCRDGSGPRSSGSRSAKRSSGRAGPPAGPSGWRRGRSPRPGDPRSAGSPREDSGDRHRWSR